MHYDKNQIQMWINSIINVIAQIADLEFQKKAWIEGRSFLSISLAETACQLYDDSHFEAFLEEGIKEKWLPQHIINKLKIFNMMLNEYLDNNGTCDLIEPGMQTDPQWHQVQSLAKDVLKDFKDLGFNLPDLSKIEYLDPPF